MASLSLTCEQLEMHGCILSRLAIDALLQRHKAINVYNAD